MRTSFLMAAMLLLALTTQACHDGSLFPIDPNPNPKPDPDSGRLAVDKIIGTQWQLQSFETIGNPAEPVPDGQICTLIFVSDQSMGGHADCNAYRASYTVGSAYSITINVGIITAAGCGSETIGFRYTQALDDATSYYATTGALRIYYDGGKKVLNFAKVIDDGIVEQQSPITSMPGLEWRLVGIEENDQTTGGSGAYRSIGADEVFTLAVPGNDAWNLAGMANCNTYRASYQIGSEFAFMVSGLNSTNIACKTTHELEAVYFDALSGAETATIFTYDGKARLEIGYHNGMRKLHFQKSSSLSPVTTLSDVIGVRWQFAAIGTSGGGFRGPLTSDPARIPAITFGANNVLSGIGYCTTFTARYDEANTATGIALGITNLDWPTTTLCPLDESEYRNTLISARSYEIVGNELFITCENDVVMVFVMA